MYQKTTGFAAAAVGGGARMYLPPGLTAAPSQSNTTSSRLQRGSWNMPIVRRRKGREEGEREGGGRGRRKSERGSERKE